MSFPCRQLADRFVQRIPTVLVEDSAAEVAGQHRRDVDRFELVVSFRELAKHRLANVVLNGVELIGRIGQTTFGGDSERSLQPIAARFRERFLADRGRSEIRVSDRAGDGLEQQRLEAGVFREVQWIAGTILDRLLVIVFTMGTGPIAQIDRRTRGRVGHLDL